MDFSRWEPAQDNLHPSISNVEAVEGVGAHNIMPKIMLPRNLQPPPPCFHFLSYTTFNSFNRYNIKQFQAVTIKTNLQHRPWRSNRPTPHSRQGPYLGLGCPSYTPSLVRP